LKPIVKPPIAVDPVSRNDKWCMRVLRKYVKITDRATRGDFIARIVFPFMFVVFNVVYWTLWTPGYDPYDADEL
jgi:hypothetical protein